VIERWTDTRRALGIASRRRLLCTLSGEPLDPSYVRHLLPRLATRASIDKRVHAHGLRHTHAAELAEEGYSVNFIQDQLGYASLDATDRYLRRIAPATRLITPAARIDATQRREWSL
jgi:site-specific recombinase XerD